MIPISVHGRFQPFHNGHLSYVLSALEAYEHVYIGITRVDGAGTTGGLRSGLHSEEDANNPFSFFQRSVLIDCGLQGAQIDRSRYTIIPFPIENPESLPLFFPRSGICCTTIKDDWNVKKIDLLENLGFTVEVLSDVERHGLKCASGTEIRSLIRKRDSSWYSFVPDGVVCKIKNWDGLPVQPDYLFP